VAGCAGESGIQAATGSGALVTYGTQVHGSTSRPAMLRPHRQAVNAALTRRKTMKNLILTVLLVLGLAGVAVAQVKYMDDKGQSHWVQSADQVPKQYRQRASTPLGEWGRGLDCSEKGQQRFRDDAATAQSVANSQEQIAKIRRQQYGAVESEEHLEARLAESRRNTLGPLERELECLKQNHAEAVRKLQK
jgi:hypothetical protein